MTALSTEKLQTLAYEMALGYHAPADLAVRFDLDPDLLTHIANEPRFRALVLSQQRSIDDSGDQLRMMARKWAGELLSQMAAIAADDRARHADRVAAFKCLAEVGDLNKQSGNTGGNNFAIQINMNP